MIKNDVYIDIVKLYFENGKSPVLVKEVLKKKYLELSSFKKADFKVLLLNLSSTGLSVTEEKIRL